MPGVSTCLHHAVAVQRKVAPADWPAALKRIPIECRQECERYLRDMQRRMRSAAAAGGQRR